MHTKLLVSLIVALCVCIGVGPAAADSSLNYPDGSRSLAINLGGGSHAFVFFDIPGDGDVFVHAVDFGANFQLVSLNGINGFGYWLDFEGVNGAFLQYGIYRCIGGPPCSFGGRVGTLFL